MASSTLLNLIFPAKRCCHELSASTLHSRCQSGMSTKLKLKPSFGHIWHQEKGNFTQKYELTIPIFVDWVRCLNAWPSEKIKSDRRCRQG
jgi:hypothetical protein